VIVLFLVLAISLILSRPRIAAVWPSPPDRVVILVVVVVGTGTLTLESAGVKPPPIPEASPLARPKAVDQLGASEDATRSAIPPDNPQTTGVALTLRAVGGLTTAEIANAFLVPEATMAQRISRGKETIRSSGVAFRMPTREERARRLNAVLHTLYLICSEGYTSSAGPTLHRTDLSSEAMRLARALQQVLPDDAEVAALLAVMLLTDARLPARTDANGELVLLDEQDGTLWNKEFIAEGVALVSAALPKGPVGPYEIQAAIAAIHDERTPCAPTCSKRPAIGRRRLRTIGKPPPALRACLKGIIS
jgi:hypothetical protein